MNGTAGAPGEPRPMTVLRNVVTDLPGAVFAAREAFGPSGRWGYYCLGAAMEGETGMEAEQARQALLAEESPLRRDAVGLATAMAGWSLEKNVYRFDERLFSKLWRTRLRGKIDTARLYELPSPCCYVEFPPTMGELKGFYVYVDYGDDDYADALNVLFDFDGDEGEDGAPRPGIAPTAMEIVPDGTIAECLRSMLAAGKAGAQIWGSAGSAKKAGVAAEAFAEHEQAAVDFFFSPLVAVALHLSSPSARITDAGERDGVRYRDVVG